eukprot:1159431-Pelagomonas_calceolata.AAC.3
MHASQHACPAQVRWSLLISGVLEMEVVDEPAVDEPAEDEDEVQLLADKKGGGYSDVSQPNLYCGLGKERKGRVLLLYLPTGRAVVAMSP